jgi:epoxide hydrolase-like predicted phosphatase
VTIRAIYTDMGGVIGRTEFQAPRQHLAERLGMEYEDVVRIVFNSETSVQASIGAISEEEHWKAIMRRLHLPLSDTDTVREEFFAGDVIDRELLDHLRELREKYKIGLISNAWSGLRPWIEKQKFEDVFDVMIISAEIGVMKPDPRIYQAALEQLGVAPAESIFIDDFVQNVEGARQVGMNAIHFTTYDQVVNELEKMLAAVV